MVFKLPHALTKPVADKHILNLQKLDQKLSVSSCLIISDKDSSES
jgi:hypothetical protein